MGMKDGIEQSDATASTQVVKWHPTLNSTLRQEGIPGRSRKRVWWLGPCNHAWQASPLSIAKGVACPFCQNRELLQGYNDVSTLFPEKASKWDTNKNGRLPEETIGVANLSCWLKDSCSHSWQGKLGSISVDCPYCLGKKVLPGFNDVKTTHPDKVQEWDYSKNAVDPTTLSFGSRHKANWRCNRGHTWMATVQEKIKSVTNGCPVCSNRAVLPGFNDLGTTNPELIAEWHPKNTQKLEQVTAGSNQRIWWLCSSGHEWEATPKDRAFKVSKKGTNCPVCSNKQIVTGTNDLSSTHPELALEWHQQKNILTPEQITSGSNKNVWWKCNLGHEWEEIVYKRRDKSKGCPTCNSIAIKKPQLVQEWHPTKNAPRVPGDVSYGSKQRYWWMCTKKHEWEATAERRAAGTGCPECQQTSFSSAHESNVFNYLTEISPSLEIRRNDRSVIYPNELDLWIPEKRIAIEYNGTYWHSEASGKPDDYHYKKWLACQKIGVQLIQIWEDDWKNKTDLVKQMLNYKLGISTQSKTPARKTTHLKLTYGQAYAFLEENHLQGGVSGSHYDGLVNGGGEVIAVLVAKWENDEKTLNIVRYATSELVPGGFTKLLKYAERTYQPDRVITFSDNCVSNGSLYRENGFVADKDLPPDYMYVVRGERRHKFGYRLKRFRNDPDLKWEAGLTERELATLNRMHRIWDAGKIRWVKNVLPQN